MVRPFWVFVGLRLLQSKHKNGFVSFISLISTLGLVLGVAALIITTSVLNGFSIALADTILGMVPQATINYPYSNTQWQDTADKLLDDPNVVATAPLVLGRGMISAGGVLQGTIVNGIDLSRQSDVSILDDAMVAGSLSSLKDGSHNIVIGQTLADEMNLSLGDTITVATVHPEQSTVGLSTRFNSLTVTGIFHASTETDTWLSYTSMADASDMLEYDAGATAIRLKLADPFLAPETTERILTNMTLFTDIKDMTVGNWTQTHGSLKESIQLQKTMMSLLLFLIILVAGFNLVSTLVMMVGEKRPQIAILKTMGASSSMVLRIFVMQGASIGFIGTLMGAVVGLGVVMVIEPVSAWVDTTFNLGLFNNYFVSALPAKVQWLDVLLIVLASMAVSLLSAVYPAFKAAKIHPVVGLASKLS